MNLLTAIISFSLSVAALAQDSKITVHAILLTWEGGVIGPQSAALSEAQRTAVSLLLENNERVAHSRSTMITLIIMSLHALPRPVQRFRQALKLDFSCPRR
jgi:hypothetical protein